MPKPQGLVNNNLPSVTADGSYAQMRIGAYNEVIVEQRRSGTYGYCDEGLYFRACARSVATTSAFGTAYNLGGATQTTFVATTPTVMVLNRSAQVSGRSMYLDYIRFVCVAAGTGPSNLHGAILLDINGGAAGAATRYTSGGVVLDTAPSNTGTIMQGIGEAPGNIAISQGQVIAGAITAGAASAHVRTHSRFSIRTAIQAIGDNVTILFGQPQPTVNNTGCVFVPPVILNPGITHTMLLYLWALGMTATPTGEFEVGWWER